jgi:hypothetical protein
MNPGDSITEQQWLSYNLQPEELTVLETTSNIYLSIVKIPADLDGDRYEVQLNSKTLFSYIDYEDSQELFEKLAECFTSQGAR